MANKLKIGFIQAANEIDIQWFKPLFYGYLKSYVEKYFEYPVEMQFLETPNDIHGYDIIGVSSTSQCLSIAQEIGKTIKESNKKVITILGGHHITYMPETLPDEFDIGVLSEGEETFLELVKYFHENGCVLKPELLREIKGIAFRENGCIVRTGKRPLIEPLDLIPIPDRSNETMPYLFSSRGCPYKCTFCSSTAFWDKTRFFSAEYLEKELENILEYSPGLTSIAIWDDLFIANKERFKGFVSIIERTKLNRKIGLSFSVRANLVDEELCKDLKRINVTDVSFGAESGSDRILGVLKKGTTVEVNQNAIDILNKYDIPVSCSFIVGIPTETESEVRSTYEFILKNLVDGKLLRSAVNILMPMPGTEVWRYALEKGFIDPANIDWKRLSVFASYRDQKVGSFEEWVDIRKKNRSIYLAEETLPEERLYELMYIYENAIKLIGTNKEQKQKELVERNDLELVYDSLSWKITAPLRKIGSLFIKS